VLESAKASISAQPDFHLGILTVWKMRLDTGGGGAGSPRATHVSAVMAVMVMMVAGVMRVVMIMVVEMGWLSRCRRGRSAAVHSLLLLEFAQPLVVALDLLSQQRILLGGSFLVVFEAADAVQPVHIDPTAPPHAHAVHDQMRAQVHLKQNVAEPDEASLLFSP